MAYESGAMDAALAAAAGNDPELRSELRKAFAESMTQHVDLLARARCDGNWTVAAMRLKGLGASFHAEELVDLAEEALNSAPGDPVILRKLGRFTNEFDAA
jgi:HPt (histidine-containing phosphotransfer) domain-containing protein